MRDVNIKLLFEHLGGSGHSLLGYLSLWAQENQ